jgi:hypothetical protein
VNYLRHACTNYEKELNRFQFKQPKQMQDKLHAVLKSMVLDAIAAAYPWLEQECLRQKAELLQDKRAVETRFPPPVRLIW